MANDSHYETWLAKQEAMGRTVPVTTSPYSPPRGNYNPAHAQVIAPAIMDIVTELAKAAPL